MTKRIQSAHSRSCILKYVFGKLVKVFKGLIFTPSINKILKELIDERDNNAKLNKEDRVKELNEQIEVVHKLLPKPATAEEITAAIDEYIKANGSITQKDMGTMMSYLGGKFTNLDRKLANTLIRAKF